LITTKFIKIKDIISEKIISEISNILSVNILTVRAELQKIVNVIKDDVICCLEYPYVEKVYRDTYYSFFSKKHNSYNRDCYRISFFTKDLSIDNYYTNASLNDYFLGYISLRPTTHRIMGNSFLHPQALKEHDFVCCLCTKTVLVNGRKLTTVGFPYCGQDNESITCSEVSILSIMDYFSSKYAEYSSMLPSKITKILAKFTYERQLPSSGISLNNISYVLKKLGFGTKIYSFDTKNNALYKYNEFIEALFIYIESGIPVILDLDNMHAVLVIGRKNISGDTVSKNESKFCTKKSLSFASFFDEILIMDDNTRPYELVQYKTRKIQSFIVPLYSKVHMYATQLMRLVEVHLENLKNNLFKDLMDFNSKYIRRYFFTSSNSYKDYIAKSDNISNEFKGIILNKSMPRFIGVCEFIKGEKITQQQTVDCIIALDATESGTGTEYAENLIFVTNTSKLIIPNPYKNKQSNINIKDADTNYLISNIRNTNIFNIFANNLKGEHTKWNN
jgi:hypothetical protein